MQKREEQATMPDMWSTYLRSDDAAAPAASVTANGGQVYMEPMDVPEKALSLGAAVIDGPDGSSFGRLATVADPTGAMFKIVAGN
jgi:predicted enzyme related to lactoylglutathione lyase